MKKVRVGLMIVFMGLILMVPMASAYSISAGDYIFLTIGTGNAVNGGGAFNVDKVDDGLGVLFDTFCLERNEDFYSGQELYVKSITAGAISGGYSGAVNGSDPISSQTAYLYYEWATGAITHNNTNAVNLQLAIWFFEGEIISGHLLDYSSAQTFIDSANHNAVNGSYYGVQVLNLYDMDGNNSQDQLVYNAVPEPATILLLGLGLMGLVGVRRKIKK